MKMLLVGAVGMLTLQVLLIFGWLAVSEQDPIILDPNRGGIVGNGIAMAAYCGPHSGKEMLDELPANGEWDTWTKGQTVILRGCADRRVANVSTGDEEPFNCSENRQI